MNFDSSHWDAVSAGYADFVLPLFSGLMIDLIKNLHLDKSMKVLDVACGPGTASLCLKDLVKEVHSFDYSKEMINLLSQTLTQKQIDNIQTHVGNGEDLSRFNDDSFDFVSSLFGLIFFNDRLRGLKEIYRVLKPGKQVLITSWPPMAESSFMTILGDALKAGGFSPPREQQIEDLGTPDPETFLNEFEQAGFVKCNRAPAKIPVPIVDVKEFWAQNIRGSIPILMVKNSLTPDQWNELSQNALNYLMQHLHPPCSLEFSVNVWQALKKLPD